MWLLDTVALSETRKPRINAGFINWLATAAPGSLHTSVVCLGEIRRGIVSLPPGDRRDAFSRWLDTDLLEWLEPRVLPIDQLVARHWGGLGRRGDDAAADALIGSTAAVHGLTVVTRNVRHFGGLGATILNPWT